MEKTFTTEGIVLKRRDYREHDRVFVVYTKDAGKIELVGQGTKKVVSKLNSPLEPANVVRLMVVRGRGYDKLAGSVLVSHCAHIREYDPPVGWGVVSYLLDVTDRLVRGNAPDAQGYALLRDAIDVLDGAVCDAHGAVEKECMLFIAHMYLLQLIALLGYRPEVYRCVSCHAGMCFPRMTF